ncbi:MAG TPA: cysteine desulfurase NifS [Deltaproteobacteria bacterium]|nr:MAG: cysteine desulfurase NifS [Deltaproteobacteria bacterium GWA2_55_82]OGQ64907.1 MAG: cysteine desulfurase NifS [Deltaproteobacteria bacterium RIFCSPLOWO2_02_FULL_55_12]OIJ73927.1 MAG: cysteine desulfurase NifS [Deltaproteobacteria bacterium GWC2_55_46]HBG46520.1 cysteine desulfurase NifS [Deltaproteobacteria bacterium]HCY09922.1 cysteine desulfurase NifS [Deltaproteobacteria bacterium]
MKRIYFDHNATTPVLDEVFDAMVPFLKEQWGNPSSIHWAGRGTKKALEDAREKVCALLNCAPLELIFTGSGTEGDNHAIKGLAWAKKDKGNHIITTKVEHPAVLNTCKHLQKEGFEVTCLDVDKYGLISLDELKAAITPKTILITVMFANNETGVLFPIKEIGAIAKEKGIAFHTDAVQAAGKIKIDVQDLNVDLLTISGHKLYGPKGVGALYVKRGTRLVPLIHGGHHERNRRGGTENVAGIIGMGKAAEVALRDMDREIAHLTVLRDRLEKGMAERVPHIMVNGAPDKRLANTANISFEFVEGESLLLNLDMKGIAASSGSACTSGSLEPSHVLVSMGLSHELSHGSVRFSLGKSNTAEEIDYLLEIMPPIVERMRSMSPLYAGAAK